MHAYRKKHQAPAHTAEISAVQLNFIQERGNLMIGHEKWTPVMAIKNRQTYQKIEQPEPAGDAGPDLHKPVDHKRVSGQPADVKNNV